MKILSLIFTITLLSSYAQASDIVCSVQNGDGSPSTKEYLFSSQNGDQYTVVLRDAKTKATIGSIVADVLQQKPELILKQYYGNSLNPLETSGSRTITIDLIKGTGTVVNDNHPKFDINAPQSPKVIVTKFNNCK